MAAIVNYSFVIEQFLKLSKIGDDNMRTILSYTNFSESPYHFCEYNIIKCNYYNIYYDKNLHSECPVCILDKVSCKCEYDCKCKCRCDYICVCEQYQICKCVYGCECGDVCECADVCICPCSCTECCYCDCRCAEECSCIIPMPIYAHNPIIINNMPIYNCDYGIYHSDTDCILRTKFQYR